MSNLDKRPANYENVLMGEEIERDVLCDEPWARAFLFAVDDETEAYSRSAGKDRLAPPAAIARDLLALFLDRYDTTDTAGLHQRETLRFHKPIRLGEALKLRGRFVEKYVRRRKGYVVFSAEAVDSAGEVVVSQRSVEVMSISAGIETGSNSAPAAKKEIKAIWPEGAPIVEKASPKMVTPAPLPPMKKFLDQNAMSVFSGVASHRRNIHNNLEKAQRFGFKNCVAAGMMEACWMSELATQFFGEAFLFGGEVSAVFISPMFAGDSIIVRGVATALTTDASNRTVCELEFSCENQDAVRTAVGSAHCII